MINKWFAVIRAGTVFLAVYCIACTSAVACQGPSFERGIIFEHVPTDIDAPIIIEATVVDIKQVGDAVGNQMELMTARIDRAIKGSIDAKTLKIFVYIGGCTRAGIGQGIILGEIVDVPPHGLMLGAIAGSNPRTWSKEFLQKQGDIWHTARCATNELGLRECRVTDR
jgi:hypothetical protein